MQHGREESRSHHARWWVPSQCHHLTGLPVVSANVNHTLNAITGAAFGAAGQRCMAISVVVLVGDAKEFLPSLIERASKLRVNGGFEPNTDLYVLFLLVHSLSLHEHVQRPCHLSGC